MRKLGYFLWSEHNRSDFPIQTVRSEPKPALFCTPCAIRRTTSSIRLLRDEARPVKFARPKQGKLSHQTDRIRPKPALFRTPRAQQGELPHQTVHSGRKPALFGSPAYITRQTSLTKPTVPGRNPPTFAHPRNSETPPANQKTEKLALQAATQCSGESEFVDEFEVAA